jgi:uncharacterized protein (TIGR02246 family)
MQSHQTPISELQYAVESTLEALCETWNRHDMDAMAALFTEDADFVNVVGMHFRNREQIVAAHRELHKNRFARTHLRQLHCDVAFLTPDIALAHVVWKMSGDLGAPGGGLRRGTMTHVLVRRNDRWYLRATQNTDIVYIPEMAQHPFWSQFM